MSERRSVWWRDADEKARWLDAAAALDARLGVVRRHAERLSLGDRATHARAARIHDFVRDSVEYRRDNEGSGREELADAAAILDRGTDDCDGKSRVFVAICRAAGIHARIRPVLDPDSGAFVHVQAEWRDDAGRWHPTELILDGVGLDDDPADAPRDRRGRRRLAGPRT